MSKFCSDNPMVVAFIVWCLCGSVYEIIKVIYGR